MAVITISRQFGSGGDELAVRLCEKLGYDYFDKRLMERVAVEVGLSQAELVDFSEENYKVRSYFERLMGRSAARPVARLQTWKEDIDGVRQEQVQSLDERAALGLVQAVVRGAYKQGDVVILGRGGQVLLRGQPGVLHLRIEAPFDARAARVQEQTGISLGEAYERIARSDNAGRHYLKHFYKVDWSDLSLYHLVINTGQVEIETAVQLIAHLVALQEGVPFSQ